MAHATNSQAPWAELAPGVGPMTIAELLALPDDGRWQYELVGGRLVRMPASGGEVSLIAGWVLTALNVFVRPRKLGYVTGADGTFDLTQPGDTAETALVPDVAFVRADRLPPRGSPEFAKAWRLAPDLAVEVASPRQHRPAMAAKAQRYLRGGTRLVWVVWPSRKEVDVWRPGDTAPSATLRADDTLDGEGVIPGFTYPVADLFA